MQTEAPLAELTYRDYIEREFRRRCRRNSQYSLRAFARDLNVSPSKLSEVMRHKCGLSAHAAQELCAGLKLSEQETEHFVVLVEAEHSRNSVRRNQARDQLRQFMAKHAYSELDIERFKIISDWHHLALLELMELEHFQSNLEWMADQLGLETLETAEALERLENFNLVEIKNGAYRPTGQNLATPSGIPSREMREFHLQIAEKAAASIEHGDLNERDVSTMVIAVDEKDFPRAQSLLKDFRRQFANQLQENPSKNRLYALGIQFFPLNKKDSP